MAIHFSKNLPSGVTIAHHRLAAAPQCVNMPMDAAQEHVVMVNEYLTKEICTANRENSIQPASSYRISFTKREIIEGDIFAVVYEKLMAIQPFAGLEAVEAVAAVPAVYDEDGNLITPEIPAVEAVEYVAPATIA